MSERDLHIKIITRGVKQYRKKKKRKKEHITKLLDLFIVMKGTVRDESSKNFVDTLQYLWEMH